MLVIVGVALLAFRRPLAGLVFGFLAYVNDPRASGRRWRRENSVLERGFEWFFVTAGIVFLVYAVLDWLDVLSLAR